MTPTADREAALRATVAENPHADAPRLVYADWLEERGETRSAGEQRLLVQLRAVAADPFADGPRLEYARICDLHGQPERAEFIRAQCELASHVTCCSTTAHGTDAICRPLRRRELELFVAAAESAMQSNTGLWGLPWRVTGWSPNRVNMDGDRLAVTFRRGFVDEVRLPLAALVGGRKVCDRCQGNILVAAGVECPVCKGDRTPGVAGRLAACPVTRVTLTGKEPEHVQRDPGFDCWTWFVGDAIAATSPNHIPNDLWRHMNRTWHPTREAALLALSHAAVNLCRSLAPGFTHQGPCGRCWGHGQVGDSELGVRYKPCLDCSGTGAATRPGLPALVWPEGGLE